MVEFELRTSLSSPEFKYLFEGKIGEALHLPRKGDLFEHFYVVYRVQEVMHKQGGYLPVIYLWQHAA